MTNTERIMRETLRMNPDGLTASEIADKTNIDVENIRKTLKQMPDCYIDRWLPSSQGNLGAVWIAVDVPENCPKPEQKLLVTKD